ncbi:sensor domain-containing diguanylate cyclase [Xanthomonas sp. NCPPB 1067]|uniref:GGDEF domain-containing protein n=1 Tax=Xanthomonas sp. NCPPB 1067 TaxID=487524 RepID=UPI001E33AA07|nr:sensor domain-containing diguanylate cyclase [Xanthomonas sp. NCPPB 1067]MCC4587747.1 sensor domain-containing diguanylate cyclase [Xanthomonas sp. NCPPB 1067]
MARRGGLLHTAGDNHATGGAGRVIKPQLPGNEAQRLIALRQYDVLDSPPERAFDDLTLVASTVCETQMAAVVLVDEHRQWFKSAHGVPRSEASRDISFCAHAILRPDEVMTVEDTLLDPRFFDNPMVTGEGAVRFYAGAPLVTSEGMALGSLCVFDQAPAHLREDQRAALQALSRQAAQLLELRLAGRQLRQQLRERDWYEQQMAQYYAAMEALNADLVEQTRTDPLTGLPNRRAFAAALAAATQQTRLANRPLSVALLDVDHFKVVNDVHGHDEGDRVLRELSSLLRAHVAGAGTIARYGGEEFVLLLPDLDLQQARLQCEYLRQGVAAMTSALPVTVSIGVAMLSAHDTAESVIKRADEALYAAKRGGRDRVVALE